MSLRIYSIAQDGFRLKGVHQPDRFLLILPLKSSSGQDDLINKMIENAFPTLMNERNGALGLSLVVRAWIVMDLRAWKTWEGRAYG